MRKICAWCMTELEICEDYSTEGDITHGICSICALEMTRDTPRTASEILNYVSEPIFVLDSECVVRAANKSAAKILSKELSDIEDQLGGDAFECIYAKNEEGCGKSIHCKTCAIRNIILDTLKTGLGYKNVPAYQTIDTPNGSKTLRFTISTEKIRERILMRIDEIDSDLSV